MRLAPPPAESDITSAAAQGRCVLSSLSSPIPPSPFSSSKPASSSSTLPSLSSQHPPQYQHPPSQQHCTTAMLPTSPPSSSAASTSTSPSSSAAPAPSASSSPVSILVIDDHPVAREPLAKLLRYEGFGAACAANGVEALAAMS